MNTIDAVRLMVRHYPGGNSAVALFLGKSPNTLEKELRGEQSHKLGLVDACMISSRCIELNTPHCRAYVNAVAGECGGFVELEVRDNMRRQDVRSGVSMVVKEASDALAAVTVAMSDDKVSDNEMRSIERELSELVGQTQEVLRAARSVHASSKPASMRSVA